MTRSSILRGPAIIQVGSLDIFTKGDIKVDFIMETFPIEASAYGHVDERTKERRVEISFEPAGEWSECLSVLFPYRTTLIGASVFGSTDTPLSIQTVDGKKITFQACAVTKMPSIILSSIKSMLGSCTFTCLGMDNTAWSTALSMVQAVSVTAFPGTSTFEPKNIFTQPYKAAWGPSPFDAMESAEGFMIDFNLSLKPLETDTDGVVDYTFEKLEVTAKFKPLGLTEQNWMDAIAWQGSGAGRGKSLATIGNPVSAVSSNLIITNNAAKGGANGVTVTLYSAAIRKTGLEFGPSTMRLGEAEFVANRILSGGAIQKLFDVA